MEEKYYIGTDLKFLINIEAEGFSMDEDNLKSIAGNLGIEYLNMNGGSKGLYHTINVIKETSKTVTEKEDGMEKYADLYYWFAIPLAIALIAELYIFSIKGRL